MAKIIVAVGSTRRPKLNAVWEALTVFGPSLDPNAPFEVVGAEVVSGVRHTPLSRSELMAGARHRAEELVKRAREEKLPWDYFVGLEGGLDVLSNGDSRSVFLQNWAFVADKNGNSAYGQSGSILLPEILAQRVVDEGIELGVAIDAFAGGHGIRDAQGAWGVLTRNMITRQDAFRTAVINAFAPFFNAALYQPVRGAALKQ
ncbi:MAG TPA: inosine/xanthosine triphosphatase [Candidatus Acidoferrales bacterium]|nr:inosine/xanthosine triphosphatase [Candidatus Acidoferrales bacterium]